MPSIGKDSIQPSLVSWRRPSVSASFQEEDFVMWRVLKELGFHYKKRDKRQYVIEQPQAIAQRHDYIQTIRKLNAHHTNDFIWLDKDGHGGWKVPSGKGSRLIAGRGD